MYQYFSTENKNETWASILICYSTLDSVHPKLIRPSSSSSSYSTYLSWSESNCSDNHGYASNPAVNRRPNLLLRGGQSLPPKITQLLRCSRRPRCYDSSHCSRIQVPRFYSPFILWIQTGKIVIKFHFCVCSEFSKIWSCVACLLFHIVKADQGWGRQEATGWPGIQRRWSKELVLIAFSLLIFFLIMIILDFCFGVSRIQVLSNAGISSILVVILWTLTGLEDKCLDSKDSVLITSLMGGVIGHYACCNGDTWSSELGILSDDQPRLITTFKVHMLFHYIMLLLWRFSPAINFLMCVSPWKCFVLVFCSLCFGCIAYSHLMSFCIFSFVLISKKKLRIFPILFLPCCISIPRLCLNTKVMLMFQWL